MTMTPADAAGGYTARVHAGVTDIAAAQWDALAGAADPFLSHAFLSLLEASGSVGAGTGWTPMPIAVHREGAADDAICALLPAYLKQHSQGEYVFDHGWAEAFENAGGQYFPKLQIAVPFTPVPGARVLAADDGAARAAIVAAEQLVDNNGLSSAHATFVAAEQLETFRDAGWMIRTGSQFHWHNAGYADFDAYLAALSSAKRKAVRRERSAAQGAVTITALTGDAIRPEHWDLMWACYQDTGARKWGTPYLTRAAFDMLGATMADHILLLVAQDADGRGIAAALNIIGADALYGRYWGALAHVPQLHFELCYYQAIEFAIARGLSRVEAGAQGGHKLARGYLPVPTYSAHYIAHPGFRRAVADFLARETAGVAQDIRWLGAHSPFRKGD